MDIGASALSSSCLREARAGRRHKLTAIPEAAGSLQVVVRAVAPSGDRLPDVELALPAGSTSVATELAQKYVGASLNVIDVSPFPRDCPNADACLLVGD